MSPIKDILQIAENVTVLLALLGGAAGGINWYVKRHDRQAAGQKAVTQIDTLATGFPNMVADMAVVKKTNEKAVDLLTSMDKGIAVMAARSEGSRTRRTD